MSTEPGTWMSISAAAKKVGITREGLRKRLERDQIRLKISGNAHLVPHAVVVALADEYERRRDLARQTEERTSRFSDAKKSTEVSHDSEKSRQRS